MKIMKIMRIIDISRGLVIPKKHYFNPPTQAGCDIAIRIFGKILPKKITSLSFIFFLFLLL